jgi:creatinine amidohydrolase/Fe(II)-dependent formamide hydrolase-like protein
MEASNAAREAQVHGSTAGKGADALEASLASEIAGVFTISLVGVLHSHRYSEARTHARTQETSRTLALHSSDAKAMAMAQSTID